MEKKCKNPRCQCLFAPDRFNRHHQEYCPKAECKKLRDAIRRKRWRDKKKQDPEYLIQEVKRVQKFRRKPQGKSPRQSKKSVASSGSRQNQAELSEKKLAIHLLELRGCLYQQQMIITGLVAHLLGSDLPELLDTVTPFLQRCRQQGQDIYRLSPVTDLINGIG